MASFGENLRRERELRGVSLREIADATKIGIRFLEALEADRLDVLPGGMFPRAFARQYVHYLGLDEEKTLAAFGHTSTQSVVTPSPPPRVGRDAHWTPESATLRHLGIAAGALVVVIALFVTGGRSLRPRPTPLAPTPMATPPPLAAPAAEPSPAPASTGLTLELRAEQMCWVEVLVDGRSVLNRVLSAGETTTHEANHEIRLSVGNAGGLTLSVNHQPGLPLGRAGEVRKNIVITRESLPSLVQGATPGASSSLSG